MSRIHDALKKAEQERADSSLPGAMGPSEAAAPAAVHHQIFPPVVTGGTAKYLSELDSPHTTAELHKMLLDRCAQCSWNPDRSMMLYFDRRKPVLGLEEFRTLRSHLYLIRDQRRLQKVLITSPLPREGKTFVAMNLAQVFVRQQERRVLLVDADLRYSRMHTSFRAPRTPGLSDYLSVEADEFSVIQRGPVPNLFFIPGGRPAPNPSELIGSGRLKLLLDRVAGAFDWVILDSPPAIPVSDAKMLADLCDGVLMVIEAGETPFDLAQKTCQELRAKHILGVVLNRLNTGHHYNSYYHDGKRKSKEGMPVPKD